VIAVGLTLAANIGYQFVVIPKIESPAHEERSAAAAMVSTRYLSPRSTGISRRDAFVPCNGSRIRLGITTNWYPMLAASVRPTAIT